MLNRLEPMTLPIAISFCPLCAATSEVTSSGRLVPMATIVRPMSVSESPNIRAMPVAPFTASCPPMMMHARPSTIFTPISSGDMGISSSSLSAAPRPCMAARICTTNTTIKTASRIRPSTREIVRSGARNRSSSTAAATDSGQSRRSSVRSMMSGHSTADNPATTSRLNTLEPSTLPTAISLAPCKAAVRLTASSGADVPKATMVRPTSKGDTPSRRAKADAPATNLSAPHTSSAKPATSITNDSIMNNPLFFIG